MRKMMAVAMLVALAACAGPQAREHVLMPAMRVAWEEIAPTVSDPQPMTQALESGDRWALLAVDWPSLLIEAMADVDRRLAEGEIGPTVAKLLRERLLQFNDAYIKVTSR